MEDTIHYGQVAPRHDYAAVAVAEDTTPMCRRWECAHYGEVDDGEDADGYPYPPCPMCYSGGRICGLPEEWMGDTDCIGQFEPREDYSAVAVAEEKR